MTEKYQEGQSIGINPSDYSADNQEAQGQFSALVKVVSSRYTSSNYTPDSGFQNKIVIKWVMLTTKGNQFDRSFSTGIPFGTGVVDISPDGKRLISRSSDFAGINGGSDAIYLFRTAIAAGFPADKLVDDVSVFEGECFFVQNANNPSWKSSKPKPYPKQYHSEGWDAALAAKQAKQGTNQFSSTASSSAVLSSVYKVPQVVVSGDVTEAASAALVEILAVAGGKVTRAEIPAKLNAIASGKGWSPKLRQDITLALWDMPTLSTVVAGNPSIQLSGEVVSFK